MKLSQAVAKAVADSPGSNAEIAEQAGVSVNTVVRCADEDFVGATSLGTVQKVLRVCGYKLVVRPIRDDRIPRRNR